MKIVLCISLMLVASSFVFGQDKSLECASCKCPETKIEASSNQASEGDILTFEVIVVDSKLKNCRLTYDWLVSAGEIISGQSTKLIRLRIPEASIGTTLSVAAFINGENGCENSPSETITIKPK